MPLLDKMSDILYHSMVLLLMMKIHDVIVPNLARSYPVIADVCPSVTHFFFNDRCFWKLDTPMIFMEAHENCKRHGGILTDVPDYETDKMLSRFFENGYWIGIHDIYQENYFVDMRNRSIVYTNWAQSQPDNSYSNCVKKGETGWFDDFCDEDWYKAMCSKEIVLNCTSEMKENLISDIYLWISVEATSFFGADGICQEHNGTFAELTDNWTLHFLYETIDNRSEVWIGVHDLVLEGYFMNIRNETQCFGPEDWKTLIDNDKTSDCVAFNGKTSRLVALPCEKQLPVLCSSSFEDPVPSVTTTSTRSVDSTSVSLSTTNTVPSTTTKSTRTVRSASASTSTTDSVQLTPTSSPTIGSSTSLSTLATSSTTGCSTSVSTSTADSVPSDQTTLLTTGSPPLVSTQTTSSTTGRSTSVSTSTTDSIPPTQSSMSTTGSSTSVSTSTTDPIPPTQSSMSTTGSSTSVSTSTTDSVPPTQSSMSTTGSSTSVSTSTTDSVPPTQSPSLTTGSLTSVSTSTSNTLSTADSSTLGSTSSTHSVPSTSTISLKTVSFTLVSSSLSKSTPKSSSTVKSSSTDTFPSAHVSSSMSKTNLMKSTTASSVNKGCMCPCERMKNQVIITDKKVLKAKIAKMKKELKVNKADLNKQLRKRVSIFDKRASAVAFGTIFGPLLIAIFIGIIVISDIPIMMRHLKYGLCKIPRKRKKKRQFDSDDVRGSSTDVQKTEIQQQKMIDNPA